MNWNLFISKLRHDPGNWHRLMPPCAPERKVWFEANYGELPGALSEMFSLFNGAELFIRGLPMVTMLGISTSPPQPALLWPMECCIDYWIDLKRHAFRSRWPIARSSYDTLWVYEADEMREWDATTERWQGDPLPISQWAKKIIEDGKASMTED